MRLKVSNTTRSGKILASRIRLVNTPWSSLTMEWKPTHVADSKLHASQCSNPGAAKPPAIYTFGHAHGTVQPAVAIPQAPGAAAAADEDLQAAIWWQPGHRPTTNDARNSDISEFWQSSAASQGGAAGAIEHVTGKDIAKRVKEAGRGSHVTLGVQGDEFCRQSKYQAEFCEKFKGQGGEAIKPVTADMFFQAKKQARSNKALGTGSSLNLSQMW